ncbi:MAG: hypothetical protein C0595_04935 [Marinilabiliales bacterium]|nr:MAG: hypothetical protein C0595_04935 [Marinilabiliales bacterium]
MKILLTFMLTIVSVLSYSQDTISIYYNSHWQRVYNKAEANFRRNYIKEGKLWHAFDYNKSGQLLKEGRYKSRKFEKQIGDFVYYHVNGQLRKKESFDDKGNLSGSFVEYYSDGSLSGEGSYVNGSLNGICNFYFKNGQQSAKVTYKNGKIKEEDYWNNDGRQLVGKEKEGANKMPSFPGGIANLYEFLRNNINYPEQAKNQGISGRVIVNFVVGTEGSISDAYIIKPLNKYLDTEALRLVNIMPKWEPGVQYNRRVQVSYNLPIRFTL